MSGALILRLSLRVGIPVVLGIVHNNSIAGGQGILIALCIDIGDAYL